MEETTDQRGQVLLEVFAVIGPKNGSESVALGLCSASSPSGSVSGHMTIPRAILVPLRDNGSNNDLHRR